MKYKAWMLVVLSITLMTFLLQIQMHCATHGDSGYPSDKNISTMKGTSKVGASLGSFESESSLDSFIDTITALTSNQSETRSMAVLAHEYMKPAAAAEVPAYLKEAKYKYEWTILAIGLIVTNPTLDSSETIIEYIERDDRIYFESQAEFDIHVKQKRLLLQYLGLVDSPVVMSWLEGFLQQMLDKPDVRSHLAASYDHLEATRESLSRQILLGLAFHNQSFLEHFLHTQAIKPESPDWLVDYVVEALCKANLYKSVGFIEVESNQAKYNEIVYNCVYPSDKG